MQTDSITIQGYEFDVPVRYAEGHTLTAGEASALNQTFHENLRNNFAKKVKEAAEAGALDVEQLQASLDAYAAQYEFGVRTGGGGGSRDPVESEAINLARKAIRKALAAKGLTKQRTAEQITLAAEALVEKDPAYRELARKRVEEQRAQADAAMLAIDELISGMPEAQPEDTGAEPEANAA